MESKLEHADDAQLGKMLHNYEDWMALGLDKKGQLHMHLPNQESVLLIGDFFVGSPEIRKIVMDYVRDRTNAKE